MTRARPRGAGSYTARLYERTAAPRPVRRPALLTSRTLPAALLLCAELTHLAAAVVEWPAAPTRGLFHVLVAAGLGVLSASVYYGQARRELVAGIAITLTIPTAWLVGASVGLPPYHDYPIIAAIAVTLLEIVAAGLLSLQPFANSRSSKRFAWRRASA